MMNSMPGFRVVVVRRWQQVGHISNAFVYSLPSVLKELQWWARRFRDVGGNLSYALEYTRKAAMEELVAEFEGATKPVMFVNPTYLREIMKKLTEKKP